MSVPTFGSLFAGIGGIDLGLERAGWTGRWQVEWDPYCQHVLAHHWPDVPRWGDITQVDWSAVEPVDLIAGGFPCQPISAAGLQRAQADDRWLWPEFARAVRALRPRYVLVENVRNLLAVNDGSAFGEVLGDLAALGYDAEWHVVSAADVGAPHLRERVWVIGRRVGPGTPDVLPSYEGRLSYVAHAPDDRAGRGEQQPQSGEGARDVAHPNGGRLLERDARERQFPEPHAGGHVADPEGSGLEGRSERGDLRPDQPRLGEDRWSGSDYWRVEPNVGRVAHGVPARVDRLRALGNAVVPQVVEVIGRRILADLERGR